jgi:putative ABC transport system substrate-binding protein
MRRREFITLFGAAATWPIAARAQQPALPVIGFLNAASAQEYAPYLTAFRQGLGEVGYVEGRNVTIEYRWADGNYDRLPALAADLVRQRVAVIAANGIAAAAAKAATTAIPIVFQMAGDPVALGWVNSMNRPGGNLTGVTTLADEMLPKRLELLHELLPGAGTIGALVNPTNDNAVTVSNSLAAAARTLGLELVILHASAERDLDAAFATLAQRHAGGLLISTDPFFISRIDLLGRLASRHAVPVIFQNREFAAAGGLMSYGRNATDNYRVVGLYSGRILKGEKPADLPIQQETKVELFINLKTAKALGLNVPLALLGRADEVFE